MKKIRIGTQSLTLSQLEREIETLIPAINGTLRMAIENIGFEPSEKLLNDCFNGGRYIAHEYHIRLHEELSRMSIPSSRTLFEKADQDGLKQFNIVREQVMSKCSSKIRKYISFDGNIAVFTDEAKKQLNEECGIYLTDPDEIELYNLHVKACEALNNFFQGHKSLEWYRLFDYQNKKFIPESLTLYDTLLSNIKIAKNGSN